MCTGCVGEFLSLNDCLPILFILRRICVSSLVHQRLDLEHITVTGTQSSIVACMAFVISSQLTLSCSWFLICDGRSRLDRRLSKFSWKSPQSTSWKLCVVEGSVSGISRLSLVTTGR